MKIEEEKKQLETEFDCDGMDVPVCPYCGHQNSDHYESVSYEDEEHSDIQCDNCEKEYRCYTRVSYTFSTDKLPCANGMPHTMRHKYKSWENTHLFKCIWCDMEIRKELSESPTDEEKQDYEIE